MRFRPYPRSLAGRLIALLLLALAGSHAISLAILSDERRLALRAAAREAAVERIVAVHALLQQTPPELHRAVLDAASSPSLQFRVSRRPTLPDREPRTRLIRMVRAALANEIGIPLRAVRIAYRERSEGTRDERPPLARLFDEDFWERPDYDDTVSWIRRLSWQGRALGPGMVASIRLPDDQGWLAAATRLTPTDQPWGGPALVSLFASGLAVIAIVILVLRRTTKPIRELAARADALGRGERLEPMTPRGPIETQQLIGAFNGMQQRLDRFLRDRMQMLAAISHDLRTPITTLRLRAELLEDEEAKEKIIATLDELQTMAEEALAFIRADAQQEETQETDLAALVAHLCAEANESGAPVAFSQAKEGSAFSASIRPTALKRALRNLIDNAVRYGGGARVSLDRDDAAILIKIEDDGPGLPDEDLERLFEPFVRVEGSRSRETGGVGLGLAIARSILRAHGGDVTLENRPDAPGLIAIARAPVRADHA
ncbi:MAG: ATP-binding protein [Alphaproteobacteria bacterium]|nr:ATP-binding protein [Alphaproteobacteria bacterium]